MSTLESLDLPYYIVARFNLRVKWVYRGILLGTGPQVEPGYKGLLSCPLFNLTDRALKITLREEFATIDFERTSDFCPGELDWQTIAGKITRSIDVEKLDEIVSSGNRSVVFRQKPYPGLEHLLDWDVVSSLVQLSNEVKTWRAIGIGILIAFFSLTLSLLSYQGNLYRELRNQDSRVGAMNENQILADWKRVQQGEEMRKLEQRIAELEKELYAKPPK